MLWIHRVAKHVNLAGWLFLALLAGLLEACVRSFALSDSVPAPSATLRALVEGLSTGTLSRHVGTTLEACAEGFALAIVGGVVVGIAIGSSRTLLDATSIVFEFLRPLPAVALIPPAIMILGLGVPMRRFVIAYAAVWPVLVNTLYGARGSDRILHDVARASGLTTLERLVRVTLPSALPSIVTGIRLSASIALLVGVTAEFVTGTAGIGGYMQRQQLAFQLPELYAAILLVGLLGYAINTGLAAVARRTVFWAGEERAV